MPGKPGQSRAFRNFIVSLEDLQLPFILSNDRGIALRKVQHFLPPNTWRLVSCKGFCFSFRATHLNLILSLMEAGAAVPSSCWFRELEKLPLVTGEGTSTSSLLIVD
jgi:hypothetical protein